MNRILLLLEMKENQRLLAEALAPRYEIIQARGEDAMDEEFDLCILDGQALDRLWDKVHKRKQESAPAFLPFLLVTARKDVRHVTRHLWRTVDELILTPIEKVELQARVEILLRARRHSHEQAARLKDEAAMEAITQVLERVSDGFVALDKNWNYTYLNQKAAQLLNLQSPGDLLGKNYWEEYPEAAGTPFAQAYQRAMEEQVTIVLEDYYAPWDRWFENHIYPSPDGISIFFTEITERVRAEKKLRESEEKYRKLTENASFGIGVSKGTKLIFANKKLLELLMVDSIDRFNEKPPLYYLTPESRVKTKERMKKLSQGVDVNENFEVDIVRTDGEQRTLELGFTNITIDGEPCRLSTYNDITERKLVEEKLKAANQQLKANNQQLRATEQQFIASNQELKKAVEEVNIQHSKVSFLYNLSSSINKSISIDDVIKQSLEQLNSMMKPYMSFFFIRNNEELNLVQACPSNNIKVFDGVETHKVGECICGLSVAQNKALYSKNIFEDIRCTWNECKNAGLKSFAALPLRDEDKVIGLIGISSMEERDFEKESEFLETVSEQISIALSKAKLLQHLKDNEARLKEAEFIAKMGNFTWDIKTGDVTWSDGLHVLLGYDKSEKIDYNRVNAEIHHPDDLERITAWLNECITSGKTNFSPNEYRLLRKDGKVIHVQTTIKVQYENNAPIKMFGTVQDITERKQAEKALKESEERFRLLTENTLDTIWSTDQNFNTIFVNNAVTKFLGYSPEEFLALKSKKFISKEDMKILQEAAEKLISEYKQGNITQQKLELKYIRKDGKIIDVEVTANLLFNDKKEFIGFQGRSIDITERKQAEHALRESEESLKTAQRIAHVGNYKYNLKTGEVYWSDELLRIYGLDPAETGNILSVEDSFKNVHPEDAEQLKLSVDKAVEQGIGISLDYRIIRTDGEQRYLFGFNEPEFDKDGNLSHILGTAQDITERVQAEEALKASENRLKQAEEIAHLGHWELNLTNNVLIWSDEVFRIFDLKPQEFEATYEAFLDHIHPDDREKVNEAYTNSLKTKTNYEIEHRLLLKNGELKYVLEKCNTTYDDTGKPIRSLGTVQDITERVQAQKELQRSETLFRAITEQSGEGLSLADNNGNYVKVNPAFCKITGFSEEELLTMNVCDLVPPETELKLFQQVRNGKSGKREAELRRKDGSRFMAEINGYPIQLAGQNLVLGIVRDITERVQVEEELRESEERYRLMLNTTLDGFILADEEGRIMQVNPGYCDMIGYSEQELLSMNIRKIEARLSDQEVTERIEQMVSQGKVRFETRHRAKDGHLIDLDVSVSIFQSGDKPLVAAFVRDITERVRAEEALKESELKFQKIISESFAGISVVNEEGKIIVWNNALEEITGIKSTETIDRYIWDVEATLIERETTGTKRKEEIKSIILDILKTGEAPWLNKVLEREYIHPDGTVKLVSGSMYTIRTQKGYLIVSISEDVTERVQAEEALQKRFKELSAVYAASQRLQKLLSPDQLAQEIIEILEHTLNYTYGAVLLVADDGETLVPFALSTQNQGEEFLAKDKEYVRSKTVRVGRGITGWVAKHGQSVCVDDVLADPRYLSMREDVRSELCVPLLVGEQVIGVVNIESPDVGAYSEDDQRLLETVAAQISAALQNAHLLEDIRQHRDRLVKLSRRLAEARETEQRAIGRELHDQFGQMLTALKLTLEIATQLPPEETNPKIEQARQIADELLSRVRTLSLELRPPMLDDLGLHSALLWLVNHYEQTSSIKAEFKQRGLEGARFDTQIETAAYRIAQEGFTNAARHAQATRVRLEVRVEAGRMHIEIEDDGVGFDPQTAPTYSRGLVGMRERAELLGGTFRIESHIGRGTRILVSLPVENGS